MKSSKIKKIFTSSLVIGCLLCLTFSYAYTIIVPDGIWSPGTISPDDYENSLYMKLRNTYATSAWATAVEGAAENWTDYSRNYVVAEVNNSDYNVECASKTTWFDFAPDDSIAMTNVRDITGVWSWNFSTGASNVGNMTSNLTYAHIYINEDTINTSYSAKKKRAIVGHEMGHVLNFGHNSSGVATIMHPQIAAQTWSNIDRPQTQDILNLINHYQDYLGR